MRNPDRAHSTWLAAGVAARAEGHPAQPPTQVAQMAQVRHLPSKLRMAMGKRGGWARLLGTLSGSAGDNVPILRPLLGAAGCQPRYL